MTATNLLLEKPEFKVTQTAKGTWREFMYANGRLYREYTSHRRVFGLPWYQYKMGRNPETGRMEAAHGFIAVGQFAKGVIAIGQVSRGWIAIGQAAFGGIASIGQLAVSPLALGQFALAGAAAAQIGVAFAGVFQVGAACVGKGMEFLQLPMPF
ncbi:MAG: hypothetical protein AAGJ79_11190 [Verrucomicrobiota bacterium]